jgi:hypothetical protein
MCRYIAVTQARAVPHIVNQLKIRTCRFLATAIPHIIELWKDLSGRSVAKAIYSKHHLTVETLHSLHIIIIIFCYFYLDWLECGLG